MEYDYGPYLMRNCVRSAALLCMLLGGSNAFGEIKDINGWNRAQWGMTENEVLDVFRGEAVRIEPGRKIRGLSEGNGAFAAIEIKTLDILNEKYGAVLFCEDRTRRLISVMLYATSPMANEAQFNSLEKTLKEKYGSPASRDDKRTISSDLLTRLWKFPSTLIRLEYQVYLIPLQEKHLRIEYRQNADKGSLDNL